MKSLAHIFWLLPILLIHHAVESNGSSITDRAEQVTTPINGGKRLNKLGKRLAKLNMVRATMPTLKDAPIIKKEGIAKMQVDDKNSSFGDAPVSGKMTHSKNGKAAISAHIIKGQFAQRGEFPWQVAIIINNDNFCGGSLISNHHVLTAAHCVYNQDNFEIIFGADKRGVDEVGTVSMISNYAVYHKGYKESTLQNDIAIITLPEAVAETKYIRIIRLPKRNQAIKFNKKGVAVSVAGWGRTTDGSLDISDDLKYIKLNTLTGADCIKTFGKSSFSAFNLCALGKNGDATCQGDSGGGLVYKDPTDNSYTLVGLVSYGAAGGCETGFPEVFTKVSNFLNWISVQTGLAV